MAGSGLLYWRILRLRRIQPRPAITFLLFEGSITLGVLLAFASVLTWWGAAAVPIAVAVMVKLNDVIATNLDLRPLAEAQLRVPRPTDGRRMGISPVPAAAAGEPAANPEGHRSSRGKDRFAGSLATDPHAESVVVRGVASVPPRSRPPVSTLALQDGTESSQDGTESFHDGRVLTESSDVTSDVASSLASDGVPDVVSDGGERGAAQPQEPAVPEPAVPEPAVPEPAVPEPAAPEPAALEPAVPEPPAPKSAAPEPAVPEPATPDGDEGRRPPSNAGHFGA